MLPSDATLLTVDTNPDFTTYLGESIDDPRLVPVTGSAADIEKILADRGLPDADFVLSGLPFSTLPPGVGAAIGEAGGVVGERIVERFLFSGLQRRQRLADVARPAPAEQDDGDVEQEGGCEGRGGRSAGPKPNRARQDPGPDQDKQDQSGQCGTGRDQVAVGHLIWIFPALGYAFYHVHPRRNTT